MLAARSKENHNRSDPHKGDGVHSAYDAKHREQDQDDAVVVLAHGRTGLSPDMGLACLSASAAGAIPRPRLRVRRLPPTERLRRRTARSRLPEISSANSDVLSARAINLIGELIQDWHCLDERRTGPSRLCIRYFVHT
jgi:hypothetical protein